MKKRLQKWRFLGIFLLLTFLLAGCGKANLSTLKPAGEVAQTQYDLMILSTVIMVLVILVVTFIFLYVVFRFRRKGNDKKIPKQIEGNHKLEIIWTTIPIVLLLILAVPTVAQTFKLADVSPMENKTKDGKTKDALVVNVRANLYWWEFEYPDYGVITSQDLVVPTDEKVYFNLSASDVKHSFWVPAVGGKLDTNVESNNRFYLEFNSKKADEASNLFYGKCAELCGDSHALMDFKVKTLSKDDFESWIGKMQKTKEKPVVEGTLAKQGEKVFQENNCIACHAISGNDKRPAVGRTAPNLANFGDREKVAGILDHNEENIKEWLTDTQKVKPSNKMPSYGKLSEQELDALAAYLMQLKVED
ncbi:MULTISPECIES: cytochrome c oxidase subunit II [Bacillus]|uniref:cytochrome c oxidase subunit II n=1 Tax=Bacillus TaxID=1386 RepID=UPI0002FC6743|nr:MULTISPECIES: cytochrome c oxidase subunit II [Bacillus]